MDMHNVRWPGWQAVRPLGGGAVGEVFEIQHYGPAGIESGALKVIRIPRDPDAIRQQLEQGHTIEDVIMRYKLRAEEVSRAYGIAAALRNHPNLLPCEEPMCEPLPDGISWELRVKSDMRVSAASLYAGGAQQEQVICLGADIAAALACIHAQGLVHESVKLANVFVTPEGTYQLGDVGAAKATGIPCGGDLKCMSPEVYWGMGYDGKSDVYALGVLLYTLLNDGCLPMTVPGADEQTVTNACARRLSGESFPAPKNGSEQLKQVVMCACAYEPAKRFASAGELADALLSLKTAAPLEAMRQEPAVQVPQQAENMQMCSEPVANIQLPEEPVRQQPELEMPIQQQPELEMPVQQQPELEMPIQQPELELPIQQREPEMPVQSNQHRSAPMQNSLYQGAQAQNSLYQDLQAQEAQPQIASVQESVVPAQQAQNSLYQDTQTQSGQYQGVQIQGVHQGVQTQGGQQQGVQNHGEPAYAEPNIKAEAASGKQKGKPSGVLFLVIAVVAALLSVAVICFFTVHIWSEVSCNEVAQCIICGKTGEKADDHLWQEASCTKAQTCLICGETAQEALGHSWIAATRETPATCEVCGKTEGTVLLPNIWVMRVISSGWQGGHKKDIEGNTISISFPEDKSFAESQITVTNSKEKEISEGISTEWIEGTAKLTIAEDMEPGVYNVQFQSAEAGAMVTICYGYESEIYLYADEHFWSGSSWCSEAHNLYLSVEGEQVSATKIASRATMFESSRDMLGMTAAAGGGWTPTAKDPVALECRNYVRDGEEGLVVFVYEGWYLACDEQGNVYMTQQLDQNCLWVSDR